MPAATGAVFFPGLLIGSYLLELLPEPSEEEQPNRTVRVPMTNASRISNAEGSRTRNYSDDSL
jgi:hypothetical protein